MNFIPNQVFNVSGLSSVTMRMRDERLKQTKVHADRNQRELTRDRMNLERKEKQLLAETKKMILKGDTAGAQLLANQVQKYRQLQHRNLQHSNHLQLKTQTLISDHKVNQAEIEGVKGWSFANTYETFGGLERREQRMSQRSGAVEYFEDSLRGCVDNLVDGSDQGDQHAPDMEEVNVRMQKMELQSIMAQALGKEKRVYFNTPDVQAPFVVIVKAMDVSSQDAGVVVALNEIGQEKPFSVSTFRIDDLKRKIVEDPYNASQLDLVWTPADNDQVGQLKPFHIGRKNPVTSQFESIPFHKSLDQVGIKDSDILYVMQRKEGTPTLPSAPSSDALLRDRINRIKHS